MRRIEPRNTGLVHVSKNNLTAMHVFLQAVCLLVTIVVYWAAEGAPIPVATCAILTIPLLYAWSAMLSPLSPADQDLMSQMVSGNVYAERWKATVEADRELLAIDMIQLVGWAENNADSD